MEEDCGAQYKMVAKCFIDFSAPLSSSRSGTLSLTIKFLLVRAARPSLNTYHSPDEN